MVKKLKWNLVLMSLLYLGLGVFLVMKPGTALNIVWVHIDEILYSPLSRPVLYSPSTAKGQRMTET